MNKFLIMDKAVEKYLIEPVVPLTTYSRVVTKCGGCARIREISYLSFKETVLSKGVYRCHQCGNKNQALTRFRLFAERHGYETHKELGAAVIAFLVKNPTLHCASPETTSHFKISPSTLQKILHKYDRTDLLQFNSTSRGEQELSLFVKTLKLNMETNVRPSFISPKELDIYLPQNNLAIEFNGLFWHSDKYKERNYHSLKHQKCKEAGVKLIQITSDEWEYKKSIVKAMLEFMLLGPRKRIGARQCIIKKPTSLEASEFLNENHLMGAFRSAKHLGLYYEDELVSLISYKKYKNGIDISRFCSKRYTVVLGGLSKLLKAASKIAAPEYIQSFVDLRYADGHSLIACGFELRGTTLGWKWTDGKSTFNRLKCRANMDERKLTEKEHAKELGWYRIFDAGQARFIKNL